MHPAVLLTVFSVLFPAKTWYAPNQPLQIVVKPPTEVALVLLDFSGKRIDPRQPAVFSKETTVDLREYWPEVSGAKPRLVRW